MSCLLSRVRVGMVWLLGCLLSVGICLESPHLLWGQTEGSAADPPFREQTIYIPYEELENVFEREGRGVFLPYEQFQALWKAARARESKPDRERSPVESLIVEAKSHAVIEGDVMVVKSELTIELLHAGWNRVPLRLSDAAIRSATVEGEPARILSERDDGYWLLWEAKGEGSPGKIVLQLEYAKSITKSPGENSVQFLAPQASLHRWEVESPQVGVQLQIQPMIAAAEMPMEAARDGGEEGERVMLRAFVGAAPHVRIAWTPKSEGASGMEALMTLQSEQVVAIDEGMMRNRFLLDYTIARSQVDRFRVTLPASQRVVNAFDANLRKWEVQTEGPLQHVSFELFEPARGAQRITLELEQLLGDDSPIQVPIPKLEAEGVNRHQGVIVVEVSDHLRSETMTRTSLLQLDASELPATLQAKRWDHAFRFASSMYELGLRMEKVLPVVHVDQLQEVFLTSEDLTIQAMVVHQIDRAGVFQLEFAIPAGVEVRRVQGRAVGDGEAIAVDSFEVQLEPTPKLIVQLARKGLGRVGIWIEMVRKLGQADLLAPTGNAVPMDLELLRPISEYLQRSAGFFVLYAPESFRVAIAERQGLRDASTAEAFQRVATTREGKFASTRESFVFGFGAEPSKVRWSVERRKPLIQVKQNLLAKVESGVVRYRTGWDYDIRYSRVPRLRIDVPQAIADRLHIDSPGVRESVMTPPPSDLEEGDVAWELTGDGEWFGNVSIRMSWEEQLGELAIGKSMEVGVPRLKPRGVDQSWGHILIAKGETLDVQPLETGEGLRPIDPKHDVAAEFAKEDIARAFEYQDTWSLPMSVTRYALQEVKRTSIERALVTLVATRSGQISVQALYRIRTARQRLTLQLPAEAAFDSQPLRIQGNSVPLERGDGDQLYIPLAKQASMEPFVLEIRYTLEGGIGDLSLPRFPEDPAEQQVYVALMVPDERVVLHASGEWIPEVRWSSQNTLRWRMSPTKSLDELTRWVREGLEKTPLTSFAVEGNYYLFSTLNPSPPPEGNLRIWSMHRGVLTSVILVVAIVMGFVLWRRRWRDKWLGVIGVLGGLMWMGVVDPLMAWQIWNTPFLLGCVLVALLWSGQAWGEMGNWVRRARWNRRETAGATTLSSGEHKNEGSDSSTERDGGKATPLRSGAESDSEQLKEDSLGNQEGGKGEHHE